MASRFGGIFSAKASFSAYVLVKMLLKTGEKVHFSTKESTTNFGLPFCFFPFPFFASKWLKYAVLKKSLAESQKRRQKTRPPPFFPILVGDFPSSSFLSFSAYQKGSRTQSGPFRKKKGETALPENPRLTFSTNRNWPRGSTGVQRYGCIPQSVANNLGEIPQKMGAPNPLF